MMKKRHVFQKFTESFAVVTIFLIPTAIFPFCWLVTIYLIFNGSLFWKSVTIVYILYINISTSKGNGPQWARSNWFGRNLRCYFPVELIKTVNLPANRHYIFATFPHGVLSYSSAVNVAFHIDNWLALFPGIRPKQTILNLYYVTPFLHEFFRLSGFISVSEKSLMYHLTSRLKGAGFTSNGVVIVVGGLQDVLDSRPGQYEITLLERKGFVRVAIKSGAAIVPCFTFGEVDVFNRWDGKWTLKWQVWLKRIIGLPSMLIKGRGGFPIPFRRRIVQIVGAPIEVKQSDNPPNEYVDEVHGKVVESVRSLFETHKRKYLDNYENIKLIIK